MTSKLINKYTKRKICMTLIRLVVSYACENWTLSVQDINTILVFERQILRKIFGAFHRKEGWRIRRNNEQQKLMKGENIVKYVKSAKNQMVGAS
jgi:hypothetical protein